MLDLTGIMFSSIMMLIVVIKAVKLDRVMPWFEIPARRPNTAATTGTPVSESSRWETSWRSRTNKASGNGR